MNQCFFEFESVTFVLIGTLLYHVDAKLHLELQRISVVQRRTNCRRPVRTSAAKLACCLKHITSESFLLMHTPETVILD